MTQSSQLKSKDSVPRGQSESISKGGSSLPAISLKRIPLNTTESALVQRVTETQTPVADIKPFQLKVELSSGKQPAHVKSYNADRTIQRKNDTGLPDTLKSGIEALSSYSMDDVKVHYNSDKPAQLQALAYAQGTDIHLAPGQEKHLPHEAWHVVQQKQQRVKPSLQLKGIHVNDDQSLENEADLMGAKAAQLKLDETLVASSQTTAPGGNGLKDSSITQPVAQGVFDLVGDTYDLNKGGELDTMINALPTAEHQERLRKVLAGPQGARIIAMGIAKDTYNLIETLTNIQHDEEYMAYISQTKGHTFQEFDKDALAAGEKHPWEKTRDTKELADFPGHVSMPYEDRLLNKSEFTSSYNAKYGGWLAGYKKADEATWFQGGAEGSSAGNNMIVDQDSWLNVETIHKAKTVPGTHTINISGSGKAESNKWYTVKDLLVVDPKAVFNYHIGVLNNALPYRKMKNLVTEYIVRTDKYGVEFTNGSGGKLSNNQEYTIRRIIDKKEISKGQTGEFGFFKAPLNCEVNFKSFGSSWLIINPATRYSLPGGYGVDFLKK